MLGIKPKLYRETEKAFKLEKNSLKKAFEDLEKRHKYSKQDILDAIKGCVEYCKANNQNDNYSFLVAFNLYVSCLNNPKK